MFFTHDPDASFGWLDDYFPGLAGETTSRYPRLAEFDALGSVTIEPVPVPPTARTASPPRTGDDPMPIWTKQCGPTSTFALLDERVVADGVARLARDLADRSWHRRYESLLTLGQLDVRSSPRRR